MPSVRFLRQLTTVSYGEVAAGDVVDVSDEDQVRFERAGLVEPATVKAKPAAEPDDGDDDAKPRRRTRGSS